MRRVRVLAAVIAATLSTGTVALAGAGTAGAGPLPAPVRGAGAMSVLAQAIRGRLGTLAVDTPVSTPSAGALAAPVPTMTVHDATGDALFPQGDLTGAGMLQNSSGTAFGVTVNLPTNPTTDANWLAGGALVVWGLDSNANGQVDRVVELGDSTTGKLIALVVDPTLSNLYCHATATYIAHVGYRATAPAGCLPHMTRARFGAFMIYTDTPSDPNTPADFAPDTGLTPPIVVQQGAGGAGYWMLGSDGHVYPFGAAIGFPGRVPGATAMAPRSDGRGYWVVDRFGHVFAYGTAPFFGGSPALGSGEFVSTIAATANGLGYLLFTNKGRAFPFGNASSYGDMSGAHLNGPIVASVATPTGHGYYMVGSDGGIFCFGDARFHGSTGNLRLNKPVVGISPTTDGSGYWLVGSDGGVFAFHAPFRGSMGGTHLNQSVDGLVAFGNGYLMAASDGGIFDFSNKPFFGSLANNPPTAPIIGLAAFTA